MTRARWIAVTATAVIITVVMFLSIRRDLHYAAINILAAGIAAVVWIMWMWRTPQKLWPLAIAPLSCLLDVIAFYTIYSYMIITTGQWNMIQLWPSIAVTHFLAVLAVTPAQMIWTRSHR